MRASTQASPPATATDAPNQIRDGCAVLAVDPGRDKCGVAVVDAGGVVLARLIVPTTDVVASLEPLLQRHEVSRLVIGSSSISRTLREELSAARPALAVAVVDETGSTLQARLLYWRANPRRGWRRLAPLSLQVPPEPIDDWAAVVLAGRYLQRSHAVVEHTQTLEPT